MNRILRDYAAFLGFTALIVALDQWTKWLVRTNLPYDGTWLPKGWDWLGQYARIIHRTNTGAAFSMFENGNLVFTTVAMIVALVIIYYYPRIPASEWVLRLSMIFYLGGTVGNLIDRLLRGEVTDFISVGSFAVFNVADACLNIGVVILILGVWLRSHSGKDNLPDAPVPPLVSE